MTNNPAKMDFELVRAIVSRIRVVKCLGVEKRIFKSLSGTALTGSLSLVFCIGNFHITNFTADCTGRDEAKVQCSCCTVCWGRINDQPNTCGRNPSSNALSVLLAEADLDRRALTSPGTPKRRSK
jgi:hypothetical protein